MKPMVKVTEALVALTLMLLVMLPANADAPFASGSFQDACAQAGRTKRIVLIDFYTTWCGPCKQLDRTTWQDKTVRGWLLKTAVCRKIDAEKQTALAAKYKVRAYPTILLLKPDGAEIDRLIGYRDAPTFLTEAKLALAGQDGIARAKAALNKAGKDQPIARMRYADALKEKGRYEEALREYLWCLDEGNKHDPGFAGVRLSFLLSDIKGLGEDYPPALNALRQRRDAARAALEKGTDNLFLAMDFAAYNRELGQPEQTLAVYDALKTSHPPLAAALFEEVRSLLLEKKRYADLVAGAGDISARVDQEIAMFRQVGNEPKLDQEIRDYMKQSALERSGQYYEALAGTERSAEADALRDKLLAFDSRPATYALLVRHAARAEKPEIVQALTALAKSKLSPADFAQFEKAATPK